MAATLDGIPDALKREPRWGNWFYRLDDKGRWTKMPTGKSNDPSTFVPFELACTRYRRGGLDGLLFALGNGWGGGDLDHCYRDGALIPVAQSLINLFPGCYRERSPGWDGCKLFFRAEQIGFQADFSKADIEFTRWFAPRFFTVTGHGDGDPTVNGDRGMALALPSEPQPLITGPREGFPDADQTTDDDLLLLMVGNDTNGEQILALWRGDKSGYGDDHSRADMALLKHLAFWTNYDAERIDRLYRQSGLMRHHWDKSASYRRASLAKALR